MNKYIEKIFNLLYSPIVTPYNLLENAKLKNYEYVKYYKEGTDGLIVEMKCLVDNVKTIFKYEFDKNDSLEKILMIQNDNKEYVFDRQEEILTAKNDYYNLINDTNLNAI